MKRPYREAAHLRQGEGLLALVPHVQKTPTGEKKHGTNPSFFGPSSTKPSLCLSRFGPTIPAELSFQVPPWREATAISISLQHSSSGVPKRGLQRLRPGPSEVPSRAWDWPRATPARQGAHGCISFQAESVAGCTFQAFLRASSCFRAKSLRELFRSPSPRKAWALLLASSHLINKWIRQ